MSVKVAGKEAQELFEEQKRLNKCLDGTFAGVKSETPDEEDVEGSKYNAFKNKCENPQQYARAVYEYAMKRDLPYCVHSRKAMRVQAAAGKIFSVLERGLALQQIKIEEEKQ